MKMEFNVKPRHFIWTFLAGAAIGGASCTALSNYRMKPEKAYLVADMDGDGSHDLIVRLESGYKVPLYEKGGFNFISGRNIKELRQNSGADYDGIEARLNPSPTPVK